jgi:hypothetical protein
MPRLARLDACPPYLPRPVPGRDGEGVADGGQTPGVFHHVIIRGIERRKILRNKKEREDFFERLADSCKADALVRMWRTFLL